MAETAGGEHGAHEAGDEPVLDPTAHWEDRYGERRRLWSGNPNAALVDAAGPLAPGRALDVGCGEGGDAVWLAEHGWTVAAVDVSPTAIGRAQELAGEHGVGDRIAWVVADLAGWEPDEAYALVSSCFLHSTIALPRAAILRRMAEAVAPGGHLLVVGHAEAPPWRRSHHQHDEHAFVGPDEEAAGLSLDPAAWETVTSEVRERRAAGPDGEEAMLLDSVLLLRRR